MKRVNKDLIITLLFIVLGIALFSYIGLTIYKDFFKKTNENTVIKNLDLYGYTLKENDTVIYKDEFDNLSKILNKKEVNYEEYAKSISKLFIIDFYTLSNKISNTDIGGLEFIYPEYVDNFKLKAKDTIYKYIEVNYNGERDQILPEVSEVIIDSLNKSTYKIKEEEFESFELNISWNYKEDLGYQKKCKMTIIKNGNKLYIVESE